MVKGRSVARGSQRRSVVRSVAIDGRGTMFFRDKLVTERCVARGG